MNDIYFVCERGGLCSRCTGTNAVKRVLDYNHSFLGGKPICMTWFLVFREMKTGSCYCIHSRRDLRMIVGCVGWGGLQVEKTIQYEHPRIDCVASGWGCFGKRFKLDAGRRRSEATLACHSFRLGGGCEIFFCFFVMSSCFFCFSIYF